MDRGRKDHLSRTQYAVLYLNAKAVSAVAKDDPKSVNSTTCNGRTPLQLAVTIRDTQKTSLLLHYGADPNLRDCYGRTALHLAVQVGSADCVKLLLNHGSNPNLADRSGNTALHFATLAHAPEICEVLKEAGASLYQLNGDGYTPFELLPAAYYLLEDDRNLDWIANVLELRRENLPETLAIRAVMRGYHALLRILVHRGCRLKVTDRDGRSVLHAVGMFGKLGMINALRDMADLLAGLDPDRQDRHGWTAIDYFQERTMRHEQEIWGDQAPVTADDEESFKRLIEDLRTRLKLVDEDCDKNLDIDSGFASEFLGRGATQSLRFISSCLLIRGFCRIAFSGFMIATALVFSLTINGRFPSLSM